jgi:hypothetical protein
VIIIHVSSITTGMYVCIEQVHVPVYANNLILVSFQNEYLECATRGPSDS